MAGLATCEIAVIGAGVVGMCVAHRLAHEGHEVVMLDPGVPGMGASYGNAGTIADYAVMPVGSPGVLRDLPSLLFDRDSPLAIRRAAILSLAPWLLRFLRQSLPGATARNAAAIGTLIADAGARWADLATALGAQDLLQARGCLYYYETATAFAAAKDDMAYRRQFGIPVDLISADELSHMEPNLPAAAGAAYFPNARFFSDPGQLMARLAAAVVAVGVRHVPQKVLELRREVGGVVLEGAQSRVRAKRVVIAAGAHGRGLARMAGDRVPLETERGYHLEFEMDTPLLHRPVCPTTRGFYLCPMAGRLRVAGTVELGGLDPRPSPHRLEMLERGARAIFPDLPAPRRSWLGFRPSMPDSLPVIGPSQAGGDVLHAYGHGHIGLTLAPLTAQIIADMVAGREPGLDVTPFRVNRF